jgi:hypothetical protein
MINLSLRTHVDILLHHTLVTHLRKKPETYIRLWEFYSQPHGTLLHLLQCMLDDGEITADNLKDGLITDDSLITLVIETPTEVKVTPKRPLLHSLLLHTRLA